MLSTVKIAFDLWYKRMTPEMFFTGMPYILKSFRFEVSKWPNFIISGSRNKRFQCTKIFYTPDNIRPLLRGNDWAFGFDYERSVKNPRYMRLPNYVRLGAGKDLVKKNVNFQKILKRKKKFCAFIYAHNVPLRNNFFERLSKYKQVDSPGPCCHNCSPIGGCKTPAESRQKVGMFEDKIKFLKDYKFAIIFENSSYPGYTTEKIYHAMLANCIPIYWGNSEIRSDFNTKSFINAHDVKFRNFEQMFEYLIEKTIEIDKDDNAYINMLKQPWLNGNKPTIYMDEKRLLNRFRQIFQNR